MKQWIHGTLALALLLGCSALARAGFLTNRAQLDSVLGSFAVTENFEKFNVANGNAAPLTDAQGNPIQTLDSTTVANGQGPGLVIPGVTFSTTGFQALQWNGADYFGQPSKNLQAESKPIRVTFDTRTLAFGLDMTVFQGFPDTANVTIFSADNTTVLATGVFNVPDTTDTNGHVIPVFLGYQDESGRGIGSVLIDNVQQTWSINIDNVEFGLGGPPIIPEPASTTLLGTAVVGISLYAIRRRRQKR
jgi:hypothetical protein